MPIYTVDVSCRASGFDYTAFFRRLESANALSFMDARWLIDVRDDIDTVTKVLLGLIAPGDRLFVTELAPETRWTGTGLRDDVKEWFRARMSSSPPSLKGSDPA